MSIFAKLRFPSWRDWFNFLSKRQPGTNVPNDSIIVTDEPYSEPVPDVPSPTNTGLVSEAGEDRTALKATQHPIGEQRNLDSTPDIKWDELISQLKSERWRPISPSPDFDDIRRERINKGFNLNHIGNTRFISDRDTHGTVCLCEEGVFYFDMDFDSTCCVSETVKGALIYLKNPGSVPVGSVRRRQDSSDGEDDISDTDESDSGVEDG